MTTQRGLTLLSGSAWGAKENKPRAFLPAADDVRVSLHNDGRDRARVRDALRPLDEDPTATWLFMLSYEACVALDKRTLTPAQALPRKDRDPTLGPDVIVRKCATTASPKQKPLRFAVPLGRTAPGAREAHIERVAKAKEALLDGVIYQANLAHRIDMPRRNFDEGLTFFLARTLTSSSSSPPCPPCAAFVDVPGFGSLVSLSPERFLDLEKSIARAYPIKGTRPRGKTAADDARLKAELVASEKDAAEHVMIVDLLRNDLGKVARPGSVTVERLLDVVSVPNVHHLESTVTARLDNGVGISDLIEATVPGGSISGAPKSSAIEIIHQLEDGPRGPYTGVLGLLENGTTLRSSLLIRTWIRPDDAVGALHVGGGIVVDSTPEAEWQETLDKAAAFG